MAFVRTAHGVGEIISTAKSGPGGTQYEVEGPGFRVWVAARDAMIVEAEAGDHVDTSNSVALPYNPEPNNDASLGTSESTLLPGDEEINTSKRLSPADSLDFDRETYSEAGPQPGPNPALFDRTSFFQHNLGPKYAHIQPAPDFRNPVWQFRNDPEEYMHRRAMAREGSLNPVVGQEQLLIEADAQMREAAWQDVRAKALRLRREGKVHVKDFDRDRIYASVEGDTGVYDVMVVKPFVHVGGSQSVTYSCDCDWGQWAFKRRLHAGRMCSHSYASYLEMQSRALSGTSNNPARQGNPYRQKAANNLGDYLHERGKNWTPKDIAQEGLEPADEAPELKHVGTKLRLVPDGFEPELHEVDDHEDQKTVDVTKLAWLFRQADGLKSPDALDDNFFMPSMSSPAPGTTQLETGTTPSPSGGREPGWGGAPGKDPNSLTGQTPAQNYGPYPQQGGVPATFGADDPGVGSAIGNAGNPLAPTDSGTSSSSSGGATDAGTSTSDFSWGGGQSDSIGAGSYTIQEGDTLSDIAQRAGYGDDYASLGDANGISNYDQINAGDTINIGTPGGSTESGAGASAAPTAAPETPASSEPPAAAAPLETPALQMPADPTGQSLTDPGLNPLTSMKHLAWIFTADDVEPADVESGPYSAPTGAPGAAPAPSVGAPVEPAAANAAPANPAGSQEVSGDAMASGSGYTPGGVETGQGGGEGGFEFGPDQFMDLASPFLDAGVGALQNIGGGIADGISSGISNLFTGAKDDGPFDTDSHHLPFNGFGGKPWLDEIGSSDEYINAEEKKNREDVDDLEGDITKYTPGRDVVADFQRENGHIMSASSGPSNDDIADAAKAFLRTAGRVYSPAEQQDLISESHPGGARNLASLDLTGTHYLNQ